ncbi:MAG: HPF/RaiA family ribosome-associated protein [Alphaproteobacteria bacterium]
MPPLKIRYHGLDQSDAIDAKLHARAEKLDRFFDRITACNVVVECANHRHHKGRIYRVGIDLVVPGTELVVSRAPDEKHEHEDVYVAIRDSFDAAERLLQNHARRKRE